MNDPLVGTTVAHYEVLEKVGGGAMGVVYRARDTRLGRQVALKFLPAVWMHDGEARQRFVREAQAASATDHRNICTIHDIGSADDGRMFLVMALYEGPTLKQRLLEGALPIDEALDIATQVAEGLAKAHAAGVVHRDIKPGNLILTEDAVKIVDFGLAKFADSLHLTTDGTSLGTAAYMSPEQVRGEEVGPAGDVWAVGVILYEMLAGHPPFRGGYAEAVAHAIRHDAPAPLRGIRPDVPEEVEQVVFRALHKEPAVRFATGRELARALRMARGQSMPQDLLTQVVARPAGQALPSLNPVARPRRWRRMMAPAAALAVAMAAGLAWAVRPLEPVPLLVAPVINQTGTAELDDYRLALTQAMVRQLESAETVRPVSVPKMLQGVRRFMTAGADPGSREAVQALTAASPVRAVALPTLLYRDGAWRGRVEIRDPATAVVAGVYETAPVVSSLGKETAHRLAYDMGALVARHFEPTGLRRLLAPAGVTPTRLRTLDAERAFVTGVSWYEEQEYARAHEAFVEAVRADEGSALALAWSARTASVVRADAEARQAADRATGALTGTVPPATRAFVEAVAAEVHGDAAVASARYESYASARARDAESLLEVASFHDRVANSRDGWLTAVQHYHAVLQRDGALIRPSIELCRLYNRLQEPAKAREQGQRALDASAAVGWVGGETLARFCLADSLRVGTEAERAQARTHAERALVLIRPLDHPYNLARALFYVGLAAASQARFPEAASWWQQADAAARAGRNRVLQPLVLMNLGVTSERLGQVEAAARYYEQSATAYEQLGDERRAAQQQANSGAFRIVYGLEPDEAVRDVRNALGVFEKLGDVDFEVFGLETLGTYDRHAGRTAEAERTLTRALALAREHNLAEKAASVSMGLARLQLEQGRYRQANIRLTEVRSEGGRYGAQALTALGLVQVKLGAFDEAAQTFVAAGHDLERRDDSGIRPQLDVALGELAVEAGRPGDARGHYARAAQWVNQRDESVVWARAMLGWLEANEGRRASGLAAVEASVRRFHEMGRVRLEAASRLLAARIHLLQRQARDARRVLELGGVSDTSLGDELAALTHYWRGRALADEGLPGVAQEFASARALIEGVARDLPDGFRQSFRQRPEIALVSGAAAGGEP